MTALESPLAWTTATLGLHRQSGIQQSLLLDAALTHGGMQIDANQDTDVWTGKGVDWTAFVLSFKGVLLEGLEVAFIVVSDGATAGQLGVAVISGAAALLVVGAIGAVLSRLVARIPRSFLQLVVGLLLTTFGSFWATEGLGVSWPGGDVASLGLLALYLLTAVINIAGERRGCAPRQTDRESQRGGAMTRVTWWLVGFGRFWYRFIIGDDWTVAASVAIGLMATGLLNRGQFPAWVVMPLVVIVILRVSVQRSKRTKGHVGASRAR
jgi:uncharacterized membrane protein